MTEENGTDMYNYHKRCHKCYFEACNRGPEMILPKPLVVSLRTPTLLHKREKWNLKQMEKGR